MHAVAQFSNFEPQREQIDVLVSSGDAENISRTIAEIYPGKRLSEFHDHTQVSVWSNDYWDMQASPRLRSTLKSQTTH